MVQLYHGTTEENYRAILSNGFVHDNVVWSCSDPGKMYFYHLDMVAREYELPPDMARERCFEMALKSASASAALTSSQSKNLVVFELQIPDSHLDCIEPDHSTGRNESVSVCVEASELAQFPCNIYGAVDHYSPMLAGLRLSAMYDNEYLSYPFLTELEKTAIEQMDREESQLIMASVDEFLCQPHLTMLHEGIHVGQENTEIQETVRYGKVEAVMDDNQILVNRLNQSMDSHKKAWMHLTPDVLIARSREITAVQDAYKFLTSANTPVKDEVKILLQCDDPLQYVAGWIEGYMERGDDLYSAYDDALYELRQDLKQQATQEAPDKPSVMERLREKRVEVQSSTDAPGTKAVDKGRGKTVR